MVLGILSHSPKPEMALNLKQSLVGVDVVSVSSFGSQSKFSFDLVPISVSSNSFDTPSFSVLKLQIEHTQSLPSAVYSGRTDSNFFPRVLPLHL